MSHLNLETLARLIDDSPDPTEAGHLDICEDCRAELEALRADANALRMLPDPQPPIAQWVALEHQLKREGLMRRSPWVYHTMRIAAVLMIFVLGTVLGTRIAGKQPAQLATSTPDVAAPSQTLTQMPVNIDSAPIAKTVSAPINAATPARNAAEASERLQDAERAYLEALNRYQQFNTRVDNGDPTARLAALESIVATTRAALGQAPADPVINGYHLTAVAQRDATLRQIAASKQQTWY